MIMDSFNDFMRTLDTDKIAGEISQLYNGKPATIVANMSQENLGACLGELYKRAVQDALDISLIYLRHYHEWLSEQL